jgi:hypothetical protein
MNSLMIIKIQIKISALGPGTSPIFSGHPIPPRHTFFPTGEWWTGYLAGVGFCGFLCNLRSSQLILITGAVDLYRNWNWQYKKWNPLMIAHPT